MPVILAFNLIVLELFRPRFGTVLDRVEITLLRNSRVGQIPAYCLSRVSCHASRCNSRFQLESVQVELESLRHRLDVVERERDLIAQNYETICTEVNKSYQYIISCIETQSCVRL